MTVRWSVTCSTHPSRHSPSRPTKPTTARRCVSRSRMKAPCRSSRAAPMRPKKPIVPSAFTDDATRSKITSAASKLGGAHRHALRQTRSKLPRRRGAGRRPLLDQVVSPDPSTTLADLLTPPLAANPFSTMRASLRRWSSDDFEDGVTHDRQGRLGRRPVDSFFPASLF